MSAPRAWHARDHGLVTFARNVVTRYASIVVTALIGIVVLPFNVHHLGSSAYGLWMLTTSITAYFTALDLGYGGAVVKFVAEFRARKDARALNETLSTMYFTFCALGVVAYLIAIVVAALLPSFFNLEAGQETTGRIVLLVTAVQVALYLPFSVFGGVINGFQRYYVNNVVGLVSSVVVALVNVVVLWLGYGLVELVVATTITRIIPFFIYRQNAYSVFPELSIRLALFRRDRLRQLTGFSAYLAVVDWSARLIYTTDTVFIGAFLNTTAVGYYAIGQRLSDTIYRVTNQMHIFLFPTVVDRATTGDRTAQRDLMVRATRLQLAAAVAVCGSVGAVGSALVRAWVGPGFESSVTVMQLLVFVVVLRAWMGMPSNVLKGTGEHRYVALVSAAAALANLLLDVVLVKAVGMVGVAWATVIPITILASVFVFPRGCRAVGLSVFEGYRRIVWPAVWPGLVVVAVLVLLADAIPSRLLLLVPVLGAACLFYVGLFFAFGLERAERQWFVAAATELWRRRAQGLAAA